MNERKLYEWIKVTPDNLPKGDGGITIRRLGTHPDYKGQYVINTITYFVKSDDEYLINGEWEYLREVDLKWPSEEQIEAFMRKIPSYDECRGAKIAIQWLQQQLKK